MHFFKLAFAALLIGAAPAEVPPGKFETWRSFDKLPLDFESGGVRVHVEALPCPKSPVGDTTCRWEGFNNQAAVSVRAVGLAPLTVTTDNQSSYARIAVVRMDRRAPHPSVIVESQSGGSGGGLTVQVLVPSGNSFRSIPIGDRNALPLEGRIEDSPRDLSGDGLVDLKLGDGAFDSAFGCNACTPRPPKLFAVKNGRIVDESSDPALRNVFKAEMQRLAPKCASKASNRNGACAAYVAVAARAGQLDSAWAMMLNHYEHNRDVWRPCRVDAKDLLEASPNCFHDFPESLRAFLERTGYIVPGTVLLP